MFSLKLSKKKVATEESGVGKVKMPKWWSRFQKKEEKGQEMEEKVTGGQDKAEKDLKNLIQKEKMGSGSGSVPMVCKPVSKLASQNDVVYPIIKDKSTKNDLNETHLLFKSKISIPNPRIMSIPDRKPQISPIDSNLKYISRGLVAERANKFEKKIAENSRIREEMQFRPHRPPNHTESTMTTSSQSQSSNLTSSSSKMSFPHTISR